MKLLEECMKCNKCVLKECMAGWFVLEDGSRIHATDDYLEYKKKLSKMVIAIDQALNHEDIYDCWVKHNKDVIVVFSLVYLGEMEGGEMYECGYR